MTTNSIAFSDINELLALHRGLMEARYCDVPNDPAVSASPILSDIHERVLGVIIDANLPAGLSPDSWRKWLAIDEGRREWLVAVKRAARRQDWMTLSDSEKRKFALCLLTPFTVSDELLDTFLSRVGQAVAE